MTETFGALIGAEILDRREAAGMTQRELAEESFPDPDKTDTIERRIRELESSTPPANPRAKTYQPLCDTLNISRDAVRAMKTQAANRQQQADTERHELREDIGSLTDALTDPTGLSRNQLISLAELFGSDTPENQSNETLRAYLTEKAEDYRRLLRDIDDLKDASARFDNMRAAATQALSELDFDKAETLLENAREIIRDQLREPLDLNAKLSERQAEIALLRNDPTQAFHILSAAADSFAALDPLDPARKRNSYRSLLYQHGLRYAGPALTLAADMTRTALAACPRATDAPFWASLQNNLGNALANLGTRTGDTDLLHQAVSAYRAALEVRTRDASEMNWAMTQNNLGTALRNLGTRTGDTDLLHQAVSAYRAALKVLTRDASEMQWAMTQNNLADAYFHLAAHEAPDRAQATLSDALRHIDNALEVLTPEGAAQYHQSASNNRTKILAARDALP